MSYAIYDMDGANLVDSFRTEDEALEMVRRHRRGRPGIYRVMGTREHG